MTRAEQLRQFVSWVIGKQAQAEIDGTATAHSFQRETAWCWDFQPRLGPVDTVFHAVLGVAGSWFGV